MSSINITLVQGRVGQDPKIFINESGKNKATFSVATNEDYKNSDGTKVSRSEWHNICCWGSLADLVEKYVHKGDLVHVSGKKLSRKYNDKNTGVEMVISEIHANHVEFVLRARQDGEAAPTEVIVETPETDLPF